MKQKQYRLLACLFIVMLAFSSITTGYSVNTPTVQAAIVTKYYIYLDDQEFEVTREQYATLYEIQNDQTALTAYLREILGDKMPENFQNISGRVVSTNVGYRPEIDDFVISDGELVRYVGTSAIVTVPSTVTAIRAGAFYGNSKVKAVILPGTVKKVENYAFYNCSTLKYVVFTANATILGNDIMYQCNKLTNLVAPKGSKAYSYAEKKEIPVTTSQKTQFLNKNMYLLPGDSDKNTILNTIYGAKWKSSKKKIVSVSSSGTVKAKKSGKSDDYCHCKRKKDNL